MELSASIAIPDDHQVASDFVILLRIVNGSDRTLAVPNPDMGTPVPEMNWTESTISYQTSLLLSFHVLSIQVIDAAGRELPRQAIPTWATPVRMPDIELEPGRSLDVPIPLGRFYQLESESPYLVRIQYGDRERRVQVEDWVRT
jgi:hypothetical protein